MFKSYERSLLQLCVDLLQKMSDFFRAKFSRETKSRENFSRENFSINFSRENFSMANISRVIRKISLPDSSAGVATGCAGAYFQPP